MFTGIIQAVATIEDCRDHGGLRTFDIRFPDGFCEGLEVGASVAIDGVCLTVTKRLEETLVRFDVMLQSLAITTLNMVERGNTVNAERAAKDGAEIGGHPLSGHVDCRVTVADILIQEENCRLRFSVSPEWMRYIFSKGYIAINGASLTIAEVDKRQGWFDVWLIPETRRMTTFSEKQVDDEVNIEIERQTQVMVDTVRDTLNEKLGPLLPVLEALAEEKGIDLDALVVRR
ncbi:riboflavin synthase subunit alpha [Salinivibrio sp. ES.052]|uniref:riboflavin synthase subunit alpha n=1 Tax=Salinivibrio sp. ES.052 TaxID=1882823 RepID=UPI0009288A0A|nr:riboflavin synthase subunit alpha [Salinivibrio sp. ES.052]SIO36023.1 riboflavin synthase alpha chain [Salinivibrio sp. ES.052]